tara:strand:- start:1073 stop:1294 length:222 start_codon:yes stop_codon:yes gene_type:complete
MYRTSLFDAFFSPPTIIVVSEERLRKAELEAKEGQLTALDNRIEQLQGYRGELAKEIEGLTMPQSLEEALTGE